MSSVVQRDALGRRTHFERPAADKVRAEEQLIDGDIHRRDFRRVDFDQRVRRVLVSQHRRIRRRQTHVLQIDRDRRGFGIGDTGRAFGLLAVELQGPRARLAVELHRCLIERGADTAELADLEIRTAEQLFGATARILAGIFVDQILPRPDIQFRQHAAYSQALGTGQTRHCRHRGTTHRDLRQNCRAVPQR